MILIQRYLTGIDSGQLRRVGKTDPLGYWSGQGPVSYNAARKSVFEAPSNTKTVHSQKQKAGSEIHAQQTITCPECPGRGTTTTESCPACGGTDQTSEPKPLRLHIRYVSEDGMTLREPLAAASKGETKIVMATIY